jgi:hypothetical protein
MSQRIVIEEQHGLGTKTVGVLFGVVGVGVVRPMLLLPEPLGASNKVRSESEKVIHPCFLGRSTMIGIVLNIETNECLGHTINDCQPKGRTVQDPQILKKKEETNEEEGTKEVSRCAKLSSTTHNLKHFLLDFSLKGSIKLVSVE